MVSVRGYRSNLYDWLDLARKPDIPSFSDRDWAASEYCYLCPVQSIWINTQVQRVCNHHRNFLSPVFSLAGLASVNTKQLYVSVLSLYTFQVWVWWLKGKYEFVIHLCETAVVQIISSKSLHYNCFAAFNVTSPRSSFFIGVHLHVVCYRA